MARNCEGRVGKLTSGIALFAVAVAAALQGCEGAADSRRASPELREASASTSLVNEATAAPAESKVQARYANAQTPAAEAARRIIYEAEISLVVKSVSDTETQVAKLLKQFDGYVAESNVDRRQGEHLVGHWKVRIPAPKFDSFLDDISKIGVAETRRQTAQDISAEYVDLEAQISNKKRLEERIVALLKDANGRMQEVIEVERELARVRGEIEQMEGRLRYMTNRTDLTTVTITAREEENYVPPTAATFADQISEAWKTSTSAPCEFGKRLTVATVYAFPWIVVTGIVAMPIGWYTNRRAAAVRRDAALRPQAPHTAT